MEATVTRLVDEARGEPVKNAYRLGWEFVQQNWTLVLATLGVFVLLTLLEMIPLIGIVAAIALGVFVQAVQIYVGRSFYEAESIERFVEGAAATSLKEFLTRYQAPAFGAWLGWFVIGMAMMLLWILMIGLSGLDPAAFEGGVQDEAQALEFLKVMGTATLPLILIGLLLSYVYPIVQGRIILSDTFGDAFKAVFSLFSPTVWSHAMKGEYFSFVLVFGLVLIGFSFVVGIVMALLMLIPVLGVIVGFVAVVLMMYVLMMVLGVANVLGREIAEGAKPV
jgi:hypothetical protein